MSRYKPYPQYKDSGIEWLGQVPEHWSIFRMKIAIDIVQNGIWGEDPVGNEDDILCARVSDFDRNKHTISDNLITLRNVPENQRKSRIVRTGDLLIEKSGGGEQTAVGAVVQYTGEASIICSNFLAIVRCKKNFSERWLCYINEFLYSLGVNIRSIKQTTGIQNIDSAQYFSEKIPIPQLKDQIKISSHLDRETTRIETLIEKKSRFIELLQEKRQALLTQAVTKGLDPNANLKDSGVKWLGLVPEHWDILRLKHISAFITSGPRGWSDFINDDGNEIFLQSGDLNDNLEILPNTAKRISAPTGAEAKRTLLEENDIVVCITGANTGRVALVKTTSSPIYINQHLCLIRLQAHRLLPKYLTLLLSSHSGRSYFNFTQYGLKEGLSLTNIATFPIMLPPYEEQQKICKYIDSINLKYNSLITATQRSMELLKERRAALITAAVTGQIDLRDSATGEGEIP